MIGIVMGIDKDAAPALGDVRALGVGDRILLNLGVEKRKDWPRYVDAIGVAITRGADVGWVRNG